MINLLPDTEKKLIEKEYRLRLIAVCVFLLFIVTLIATVFLLPSYVLSTYKMRNAEIAARGTDDDAVGKENVAGEIKDTQALMRVLSVNAKRTPPSEFIALVAKHRGDATIMSINYTARDDKGFQAIVNGVARNRQALINFRNGMKTESIISKSDVPVSDLAKDSNINFTLTIEGAF